MAFRRGAWLVQLIDGGRKGGCEELGVTAQSAKDVAASLQPNNCFLVGCLLLDET